MDDSLFPDGPETVGFRIVTNYGTEPTNLDGSPVEPLTDEKRRELLEALRRSSE